MGTNSAHFYYRPVKVKMKVLLFIICFGVIALATVAQDADGIHGKFEKLYWLNGTWNQTNIKKPGRALVEQWRKSGDFEMVGLAVTTQNSDTVFVERASLIIKNNAIYYVADVPQNKESVLFKLTAVTKNGFVCENPTHDFPKRISYQLTAGELKATISGNGKSINYLYQKVQ